MQRYFSHICDGTDGQEDWRSWTYGRALNAIEFSQGSLMCPSYTDTRTPFLYGDFLMSTQNYPNIIMKRQ